MITLNVLRSAVLAIGVVASTSPALASNFFAPDKTCTYPTTCESTWDLMDLSLDSAVDWLAQNFGQGANAKDGDRIFASVNQKKYPGTPSGCYRRWTYRHEVDVIPGGATLINTTLTSGPVIGCGI